MTEIIIVVLTYVVATLGFPLLLFLRARRSPEWDDSNMTNIYRVIAHLATHPDDFAHMQYKDGSRPFWYISKDELSEVVKTRK